MSKALRKTIMHSSRLKDICNKCRTVDSRSNYIKQRNFCVNLLLNAKAEYFQKLNLKDLSDNKEFWKTTKLYISNRCLNSNKFVLKEKNGLITELATVMNTFFVNVTEGLYIKNDNDSSLNSINYQNINDAPGI